MSAEGDVKWLQELVDILRPDLYQADEYSPAFEPVNQLEIEFSGCCYLDHTMRLVRDHVRKYDFSSIPEFHGDDETFDYDKNVWVKKEA